MSVDVPNKSLANTRQLNGFNRTSSAGNHVPRAQNGRVVHSSASGNMASISESTVLERDEIQEAGASSLPYNDYGLSQPKFSDRRTQLIIKLIFCKLCPACSKDITRVERDIARMEQAADRDLVYVVVEMTVKLLREWNMIKSNLDDFRRNNWNVYVGNMHTEFSKVAYEQFCTTVSWGRVIIFIGFSVSYSIYSLEREIPVAASSVMEWTRQVVEEDLAKFFFSSGGWEGYADFLEKSMRRAIHLKNHAPLSRSLPCEQQQQVALPGADGSVVGNGVASDRDSSMWPRALAASALAIGAITAFTLKQAFS